MNKRVNIYEAKTHLSELINKVCETGEPYTICKNNKPVVDVVVHGEQPKKSKLPDPLPEYDGKAVYLCDPLESTEDLWPEEYR
jgi:prevent-host-death family protein